MGKNKTRIFKHFEYPKSIENEIKKLKTNPPEYWEELGQKNAIKLANFVISSVPAYKKFLNRNKIFINKVNRISDFQKLPLIDKQSYLRSSNYNELFPVGYEVFMTTISSTSGSTGEPFYFPRGEHEDSQYEFIAEVFLKNQFDLDKKRTLGIIGFGLGIWIGGIFTYKNLNRVASKGYPLALAPVGTNKELFLKAFQNMAGLFDQVILMGYPPLVKDILDEGINMGIDWSKYDIKIFVATEGFSEEFREYLVKKTGIKNKFLHTINIYGSVEFGTMSHETPISILIRDFANKDRKIFDVIFPNAKVLPTLVQYYPHIVYFEEVDGEVVASGMGSSFPLIRYRFHDKGGVVGFQDMLIKLKSVGIDILKEAKKAGIDKTTLKLPFVYVAERSDFVVIYLGANIYPQNIKTALEKRELEDFVTGRFNMEVVEDKDLNKHLIVRIEMKTGVKISNNLLNIVTENVFTTLCSVNSEYNNSFKAKGVEAKPVIKLYEHGNDEYFKSDVIKQKWVKNN